MHAKFWFENINRRDHLRDLEIVGKIVLELVLMK
jgi:hypothetical protein